MNEMEQETAQDNAEESSVYSVNINSVHFNKNHSVITANFKTSGGKICTIVPHKVDTCSDGNIMPLHLYKNDFLG